MASGVATSSAIRSASPSTVCLDRCAHLSVLSVSTLRPCADLPVRASLCVPCLSVCLSACAPQDASQQEVFDYSAKGLIRSVLDDGCNATVFAYGVFVRAPYRSPAVSVGRTSRGRQAGRSGHTTPVAGT